MYINNQCFNQIDDLIKIFFEFGFFIPLPVKSHRDLCTSEGRIKKEWILFTHINDVAYIRISVDEAISNSTSHFVVSRYQ